MGKSKNGRIAVVTAVIAFFFTILAFTTPHWLENDRKLPEAKFTNIGLWSVCFKNFEDPRHLHDVSFSGCWWVFEEEYYIIQDFLLPGFFVATQFFYTLSFTLLIIASFLVTAYLTCSKSHERFILLLFVVGSDLLFSAFSGTLAVIIFGARGDGRDWMPHWEHNDIGWSYAMAVLGVLFLYISGTLFIVEGRVHRRKQSAEYRDRDVNHQMNPTKSSYI